MSTARLPGLFMISPLNMQKNLTSIVWLYRKQNDRFTSLVSEYLTETCGSAQDCVKPLGEFCTSLEKIIKPVNAFLSKQKLSKEHLEQLNELSETRSTVTEEIESFNKQFTTLSKKKTDVADIKKLSILSGEWEPLAEQSRDIVKSIDLLYKLIQKNFETAEVDYAARKEDIWEGKEIQKSLKSLDEERRALIDSLKLVGYYYKQTHWLLERFPEGKYKDVEGLCKLVNISEIKKNDWSLTPGRYVGVAPEEEDEGFDFEETMREIHTELKSLNEEAVVLADKIQKNFEELGI